MKRLFLLILNDLADNPFVAVFLNPHIEVFESREKVFVLGGWCSLLCGVLAIGDSPEIVVGVSGYGERRAVGGACIVGAYAWR